MRNIVFAFGLISVIFALASALVIMYLVLGLTVNSPILKTPGLESLYVVFMCALNAYIAYGVRKFSEVAYAIGLIELILFTLYFLVDVLADVIDIQNFTSLSFILILVGLIMQLKRDFNTHVKFGG